MFGITADVGVDGDIALYVLQREVACAVTAHHTAGMFGGGVDGSGGDEVLDGGTIGVVEWSAVLFGGRIVDG